MTEPRVVQVVVTMTSVDTGRSPKVQRIPHDLPLVGHLRQDHQKVHVAFPDPETEQDDPHRTKSFNDASWVPSVGQTPGTTPALRPTVRQAWTGPNIGPGRKGTVSPRPVEAPPGMGEYHPDFRRYNAAMPPRRGPVGGPSMRFARMCSALRRIARLVFSSLDPWEEELRFMARWSSGSPVGPGHSGVPAGTRTWRREDLYDRRPD